MTNPRRGRESRRRDAGLLNLAGKRGQPPAVAPSNRGKHSRPAAGRGGPHTLPPPDVQYAQHPVRTAGKPVIMAGRLIKSASLPSVA